MSTSAEEQDLEKSYRALQSPNATVPTEELRRALEPFAKMAREWDGEPETLEVELRAYDDRICPGLSVADFRLAREALAATQEQPDNYNSKLADELQTLCCAETEGKFFDCVTDNIQTIIAALRSVPPARFNGEAALAEWEGKHGGGK